MSAHYFQNDTMRGAIHLADIYKFEGVTFEWHHYCGPRLCRKDGNHAARQPGKRSRFWDVIGRWDKLTKDQKEKTRIYG